MDDSVPLYSQESIQKMEYPGTALSAPPALPINAPLPLLIGPENVVTTCPHCQTAVRTSIKYTATTRTHITALLCSFIWFLSIIFPTCCCCCLPYCMTSTRNTDHYCPSCFKYLGTYQK